MSRCDSCDKKNPKYIQSGTSYKFCNEICQFEFINAPKRSRDEYESEKLKGIITINVGGKKFVTLKTTFQKYEHSILFLLVEPGRIPFATDADGLPFLDMNPNSFELILDWLRTGKKQNTVNLENELKYLMLWDDYNFLDFSKEGLTTESKEEKEKIDLLIVKEFYSFIKSYIDENPDVIEKDDYIDIRDFKSKHINNYIMRMQRLKSIKKLNDAFEMNDHSYEIKFRK